MMSPAHTRRVSAGSPPVTIQAGRITLRISSQTGQAVRPLVTDNDMPAVLRPVAVDAWNVDLAAGSRGRLVLRPAPEDGPVFPRGSALKVTVDTPNMRLNVFPDPDVSSLAGPTLFAWSPAGEPNGVEGNVGAESSDLLLLWIVDVTAHTDAALRPVPAVTSVPPQARVSVEALGTVALQARDIAREIIGGPRLPAESQRAMHLVIDASTSMRALDGDRRLSDVVAAALGAAEVVGSQPPVVHIAEGPTVRRPPIPEEEVSGWISREYRPDAFGNSLVAVQQVLPSSEVGLLVVVVTDDVPPDLVTVRRTRNDRWQVLVLEPPSAVGVTDVREISQDGVLRIAGARSPGDVPDAEQLRRIVTVLMKGER